MQVRNYLLASPLRLGVLAEAFWVPSTFTTCAKSSARARSLPFAQKNNTNIYIYIYIYVYKGTTKEKRAPVLWDKRNKSVSTYKLSMLVPQVRLLAGAILLECCTKRNERRPFSEARLWRLAAGGSGQVPGKSWSWAGLALAGPGLALGLRLLPA